MHVKLTQSDKIQILNGEDVYGIMQRILLRANKIDRNKEHFWTVGLNTANQILYVELISLGSSRMTLVEPMQVYRVAILKGAVKLILVHNHPSGGLKPSESDLRLSDKLIQVGRIIDIEVIDHLVITQEAYYSFAEHGLMEALWKSTQFVPDYELRTRMKRELGKELLKKGKQDEKKEIARKMKAQGYAIEIIADLTGLSVSSVEKLKG